MDDKTMVRHICRVCGKEFFTQWSRGCYCSKECEAERKRRENEEQRKRTQRARAISGKPVKMPKQMDPAKRMCKMGCTYWRRLSSSYMEDNRPIRACHCLLDTGHRSGLDHKTGECPSYTPKKRKGGYTE